MVQIFKYKEMILSYSNKDYYHSITIRANGINEVTVIIKGKTVYNNYATNIIDNNLTLSFIDALGYKQSFAKTTHQLTTSTS